MMPSHSLICCKVVEKCPVVGFGENVRREAVAARFQEGQAKHFHVLRRETSRMLWNANRVSQENNKKTYNMVADYNVNTT